MSPTVLRIRGFRFYFFSREEAKPHVHVPHATGEAKFWLEPDVEIAENYGPQPRSASDGLAPCALSIRMRSQPRGTHTSGVEVTNVSPHGFWLLVDERELFVPFAAFPWFQDATIRELGQVERPSPHHLRWPALDIDLALDSLEHPERYPLVSRVRSAERRSKSSPPAKRKRRA